MADGVDTDDLAVLGELDGGGDDGHLDGLAGPPAAGGVRGAREADDAGTVAEPGDGEPGRGVPGPPDNRCSRDPVGLISAQPLGVGGHDHAAVQDVDQPAGGDDLDRLAGVSRPRPGS